MLRALPLSYSSVFSLRVRGHIVAANTQVEVKIERMGFEPTTAQLNVVPSAFAPAGASEFCVVRASSAPEGRRMVATGSARTRQLSLRNPWINFGRSRGLRFTRGYILAAPSGLHILARGDNCRHDK